MTEEGSARWRVTSGAVSRPIRTRRSADGAVLEIEIGSGDTARTLTATILSSSEDACLVSIEGQSTMVRLAPHSDGFHAMAHDETFTVVSAAGAGADSRGGDGPGAADTSPTAALDALSAPMPATVSAILVEPGTVVEAGDTLLRLEAMKMELAIRAPSTGRVATVACSVGDLVQPGRPLVSLEAHPVTPPDDLSDR